MPAADITALRGFTGVQRRDSEDAVQQARAFVVRASNTGGEDIICGNPSCAAFQEGTPFKKCSSCKLPYCSVACQHQDWKQNNHKALCGSAVAKRSAGRQA